jgi:antitoxin component YwqK of YwqJK toxin-antitoxin module
MKKFLLLIVIVPMFCYGQKLPDSGFDKIRIVGADKIIQAEIDPVSSDPSLKSNRLYYWYSSNAIHATQGSFSGTLLNGSYDEYYLNKSLKEQGQFNKGSKAGVWRDWTENGTLVQWYTWKKGIKSGKFELFDEQGSVKQKGRYKNGVFVNDSRSFWQKLNIFKKK